MQDAWIIGTSCTRFGKQPGASFKDLTREAYLAVLADAGFSDGAQIGNAWFGDCGMAQWGQGNIRGQVCFTPQVREGLFPERLGMTNVEGGCATASMALHGAWKDVLSGTADLSLAIGVEKTFVPDSVGQFTSDHGWNLPADADTLRPLIAECRALGVRVSLCMDPQPAMMAAGKAAGADRVELYTESYASAWGTAGKPDALQRFAVAAQAALDAGLGVNAGHDLSRENLADFLRAVPGVQEVSIGHALISDALELGYEATVKAYLAQIHSAFA